MAIDLEMIERSPVISLKSQHQFRCTFAVVKRGAGDYSGKKQKAKKKEKESSLAWFLNSEIVYEFVEVVVARDKEKKQTL